MASNDNQESVFDAQAREGADYDQSNGFNFWVRPRNSSTIFGFVFVYRPKVCIMNMSQMILRRTATIFATGDIISNEPIPGLTTGDNVNLLPFQASWAPETRYGCAKYEGCVREE